MQWMLFLSNLQQRSVVSTNIALWEKHGEALEKFNSKQVIEMERS